MTRFTPLSEGDISKLIRRVHAECSAMGVPPPSISTTSYPEEDRVEIVISWTRATWSPLAGLVTTTSKVTENGR